VSKGTRANNKDLPKPTQPSIPPGSVNKYQLASAEKEKAGMVHSVSGCTQGVQLKLRSRENACHT